MSLIAERGFVLFVLFQVPYFSGRTGAKLMEFTGQHLLSLWRDPIHFEDAINSVAKEYAGITPLQFVEVGSYVGLARYARMTCEAIGDTDIQLRDDVSCFSLTGSFQLSNAEQALRKKAESSSSELALPLTQHLSADLTTSLPQGLKLYVFSGVSPRYVDRTPNEGRVGVYLLQCCGRLKPKNIYPIATMMWTAET